MLEQWKRKIKALFTEEEINIENEPSQVQQKQNVQAKIKYQYPEKKSFRFPVIPDRIEEQKVTDDKPAYQRKRNNVERESKKVVQQPIRQNSTVYSNKVYKKNIDVPFQPTEVPSPIYGFNPRKKDKEIEEIPAFKRKQEKVERQENEQSSWQRQSFNTESQMETKEKYAPLEVIHNEAASIKEEVNEAVGMEEEVDEAVSIKEEVDETASSKEEVNEAVSTNKDVNESASTKEVVDEPKQDLEKQQPEMKKNEIQNTSKAYHNHNKNNTTSYKSNSRSERGPYNVIMTPRDKKNLFDKQKEKDNKTMDSQLQEKSVPYHLLNDPIPKSNEDRIWVEQQQRLLEETLKHFNVRAKVVNATQGPSVTRFEVHPELGVKVSKVKNLSDDLKLNMSAKDIRIEAPIPGKNTIGIEIPNPKAQMVGLQGIFETEQFKQSSSPLTIALGLSIEGHPMITNIQKMPHGLIAGATGSGKSVCINTILISLLYKASHEDVKFMLIDPKMVELAPYNGIPHLVSPVITDVKAATAALKWAVNEMEDRYEKFVHEGVRDIERYNQKVIKQGRADEKMPFIVIVIDELADLMMVSPQDVEDAISRIAQKARACGIHLLLATQRPSVDVITGLIKANIPTRIAFSVSSQIDSRTIIDSSGAEKLLGKGDMLFIENGAGKSIRLQGPFVSDEEIERVTNYARSIAAPNYLFEQEQLLEQVHVDEEEDVLLQEAIQFVLNQNSASTSLLQRHFKIGYNRAARLIDTLEHRGIISGQNGSKPREVLITQTQMEEI